MKQSKAVVFCNKTTETIICHTTVEAIEKARSDNNLIEIHPIMIKTVCLDYISPPEYDWCPVFHPDDEHTTDIWYGKSWELKTVEKGEHYISVNCDKHESKGIVLSAETPSPRLTNSKRWVLIS